MNSTNKKNNYPSARISRLLVYPIKSCGPMEVQQIELTDTGLSLDRHWMLVDETGQFLTQRQHPRLALVSPHLKLSDLILKAPGMLSLHLSLNFVDSPVKVRIWGEEVSAFDMGDFAAQWFSEFLNQGLSSSPLSRVRLARFDPDHLRLADPKWTKGVQALNQFSDGFPLLLVGESSLTHLNERLASAGFSPVTIERFRPNIVLQGWPPHEEDSMTQLEIASNPESVIMKPVKPCSRCSIPDIDPITALSGSEVSTILQKYRKDPRLSGAISFGMNCITLSGFESILKVGQEVFGETT